MTGNDKRINFRIHIITYEEDRLMTGIYGASLHIRIGYWHIYGKDYIGNRSTHERRRKSMAFYMSLLGYEFIGL